MDDKLFCKIFKGIERMAGIEALLIFAVAALNFSVMPGGVGTNELVADA